MAQVNDEKPLTQHLKEQFWTGIAIAAGAAVFNYAIAMAFVRRYESGTLSDAGKHKLRGALGRGTGIGQGPFDQGGE